MCTNGRWLEIWGGGDMTRGHKIKGMNIIFNGYPSNWYTGHSISFDTKGTFTVLKLFDFSV